jgi:membrane protein implicated in regulation of membrane protease activity
MRIRNVVPYVLVAVLAVALAVVSDALSWSGSATFAVGALAAFLFVLIVAPLVHGRRRRRRGEIIAVGGTVEVLKIEQKGRGFLSVRGATAGGRAPGHNGVTATPH